MSKWFGQSMGSLSAQDLPAGSVFLYGEREFVWHRRTKPSEYVNLALDPTLLQRIAIEHGLSSATAIEHRVIFQDPTILHVAQLLKAEVLSGGLIPMSQFHFARAFKAAVGDSPHRYILQRRIERAKMLLSVTRLAVAEVSYQTGFSNQSHLFHRPVSQKYWHDSETVPRQPRSRLQPILRPKA